MPGGVAANGFDQKYVGDARKHHLLDDVFGSGVARVSRAGGIRQRCLRYGSDPFSSQCNADGRGEEQPSRIIGRGAKIEQSAGACNLGLERLQRVVEVDLPGVVDDVSRGS